MTPEASRIVYGLTARIAFTGLVFCLFFQINKSGPFRDINPFGKDPYDAVNSFAVQGVFLLATLTYARAVRFRDDLTGCQNRPDLPGKFPGAGRHAGRTHQRWGPTGDLR